MNGPRNSKKIFTFVNGSFLVGALFLFFGLAIGKGFLFEEIPDWYAALVIIVSLPWLMAGCVSIIVYQEIPRIGMKSIKGSWATIQGWVGLLVIALAELFFIYQLILMIS